MTKMRRTCYLAVIFPLLLSAGCGREKVAVKGTVTLDNIPLANGIIDFNPTDGKGANMGAAIKDGKYELVGDSAVLPGRKTIHITATRATGKKLAAFPLDPPEKYVDEIVQIIPAKYNTSSELTVVLEAGKVVEHDIHLKCN